MNRSIFDVGPGGEVAVIGLGRSGRAVAELVARDGHRVYASDSGRDALTSGSVDALRASGVEVQVGGHDLERVAAAALVVASPGVPPDAPPLLAARDAERRGTTRVVSEVEVALRYMPELRYIAITGTNGKTTTTALVGELLRGLGLDAVDAGNIGTPLAAVALMDRRPTWAALELSSFQLHDTPSLDPTVGVLTNLSPDHLDRYANVADYYADKRRMFANAWGASLTVSNADDELVERMTEGVPGTRWRFSAQGARCEARHDRGSAMLELLGSPLMPRAEFPLLGDHNVANALAAALAVAMADPAHRSADARAVMRGVLRGFAAMPHRMEPVGEVDGVLWINDSKATNVSSVRVALAGMTRPYVLLLGGRHKGEPYDSLAAPFAAYGRVILAFGEARERIVHDLGGQLTVERLDGDFGSVMRRARELALPGDAVLLSPACSSYDMFANYEERGATFRELAMGGVG